MRGRAIGAELLGTSMLAYVVAGSGIVAERLGGDPTGQLFIHATMVGLGLAALIGFLGSTSGAHFNPAVTVGFWLRRSIDARTALGYVLAQVTGSILGIVLAVAGFGLALSVSSSPRPGWGAMLAEVVGTSILVLLILGMVDQGREDRVPAAAGAWVAAMIFSSASTGILNPALSLARTLTDTYTGIAPEAVPGLILAQMAGAVIAVLLSTRLLLTPEPKGA